jgi:hypothetical protein
MSKDDLVDSLAYNSLKVRKCRRFDLEVSLDQRVKLSLSVPAQMGWREMEHKGGKPRLMLSCARGMRLQ